MVISEAELLHRVASFLWPLLRIGAMFVAIPVFSAQAVTPRVRILLAVALALIVAPLLPPLPPIEMFSYTGVSVAIQQVLIGLVTGFVLQLAFAVLVFSGQIVAYSMGLGFAAMVDPATGTQAPVVSQFYVITSTLLFLLLDGHLIAIEMLVNSFKTLPISVDALENADYWQLVAWGAHLFADGVLLALPVMACLLLVNISFGVATRAAPQLNIFSVGFPVTLLLGLLLIWLTLPAMLHEFTTQLDDVYALLRQLLRLP